MRCSPPHVRVATHISGSARVWQRLFVDIVHPPRHSKRTSVEAIDGIALSSATIMRILPGNLHKTHVVRTAYAVPLYRCGCGKDDSCRR